MPDATETQPSNGTQESLLTRSRKLFQKENQTQNGDTPSSRLAALERSSLREPLTGPGRDHPETTVPDLTAAGLRPQQRADLATELSAIGNSIHEQREPIDPELEEALFTDSERFTPNASLAYQTPDPGASAQDRACLALEALALEMGAEGLPSLDGSSTLTGEKAAELRSIIDAQLNATAEAIAKALKTKSRAQEEAEGQMDGKKDRTSTYLPLTEEQVAAGVAQDVALLRNNKDDPLTKDEQAAVDHDLQVWRDAHGLKESKEPIAVRLTEEQTRLLVKNEYPDNVQAQNQALYEITNTDSTVSVLKDAVQLDYSEQENTFFASLEKEEKPALDQKLTQLQAEQERRRQPPPQERERGRQRDRSKDYERD